MNRNTYYNYIEEKLKTLSTRIELRGSLNILDFHVHSENFYSYFFNNLFDWYLENSNKLKQNIEAIDLIDKTNKFIIQVSATNTKAKVESALSKSSLINYSGYRFKFISISKNADHLKTQSFSNPYNLEFENNTDIYDIDSILKEIFSLPIDKQKKVYEFIKKELGNEMDFVKLDSNLASVINILSQEDWGITGSLDQENSFEIDRKIIYNNLITTKDIIDDFKMHYGRLDKIYTEFDTLGVNKSNSVLGKIRMEYVKAKSTLSDDKLFLEVIQKIQETIQSSANYNQINNEELLLCVNILVVDAFIRCKIFENPNNYNYVTSR